MIVIETLFLLSILVIVHEFGHFAAAKKLGIKVLRFSVGFGPRVVSWIWKGTEFCVSAVPFGGYVKMAGDEPEEGKEYGPECFLGRPAGHRLLVVISGPIANLLFGFLVYLFAYGVFGVTTFPGNVVGKVIENSPAASAGIAPGDTILSVDGVKFENWSWFYSVVREGRHVLEVLREKDTLKIELELQKGEDVGIVPYVPARVGRVMKGGPAYRAGIREGDLIISIDGKEIGSWDELVEIVRRHPGDTLEIKWLRDGKVLTSQVVPEVVTELEGGKEKKIGRIGIKVTSLRLRLPPAEVLKLSIDRTIESTMLIFYVFYKILSGGVSVKNVGGPIMIGKLVSESQSYGLFSLLMLLALISINLFVVNVIPLPALDGGHIIVYSIEAITGRQVPPKVQAIIQQIGFGIIILLILLVMVMDILRLVGR